jgi:hypothetical protein
VFCVVSAALELLWSTPSGHQEVWSIGVIGLLERVLPQAEKIWVIAGDACAFGDFICSPAVVSQRTGRGITFPKVSPLPCDYSLLGSF